MVDIVRPGGFTNEKGVAVHLAGSPVDEILIPTGQTVTPGAVVQSSTTAGEGQEAAADSVTVIGWAPDNISQKNPTDGSAVDVRADYAAGDRVVIFGTPGDEFMGILADQVSATAVPKGRLLKAAANGTLTPLAAADSPAMAVARVWADGGIVANGAVARGLIRWGVS